ncbi:hypothetical protein ROJ8625_00949 [Roseivivax jejudonensis]|uniref:Uncharacterized protein n=1 Tax=Roseivivax jejudonensis TaxID=1529041 RepID=A0A1X6YJT8_9RHOB|nr:hypothetical protein [Roseivivax jejudonensis]SLN23546.1 hypothetical protein ROJ8625_00949 [Roseivivax jejudonensis]
MNDIERACASLQRTVADITGSIEEVFETTSMSVFDQLSEIQAIAQAITQIREVAAPDGLEELCTAVSDAVSYLDRIGAQYDFLEKVADKLKEQAKEIGESLNAQDRNMRLASMIAMNAQVISKSVKGADVSLASFAEQVRPIVDRADAAARAVENGLHQADAQLSGVRTQIDELCATVRALTACRHEVQKLVTAFSDRSGIETALDSVLETSRHLRNDLNAVVGHLQCGDASRQRLEHINVMLDTAISSDRTTQAVIFKIASAQFAATTSELRSAVGDALPKLTSISSLIDRAHDSVSALADAKLVASLEVAAENIRFIANGVGQVAEQKDHLAPQMERLTALYRTGASSTEQMSSLNEAMLHLGINATLVSSKLGSEGRAMVEVSQQLHHCTLEVSQSNMQVVHSAKLQELNAILFAAIAGVDDHTDAAEMVDTLANAHRTIGNGISSLERCVSKDSKKSFRAAYDRLSRFSRKRALSVECPSYPVETLAPADDLAAKIDGIRESYTMQSEREVHDAIVRQVCLERPDLETGSPHEVRQSRDEQIFARRRMTHPEPALQRGVGPRP